MISPVQHELNAPLEPAWCVVANVVRERVYGPGGIERRSGTKHFAPGTKLYVCNFFWGVGGERITVIGRHRKSRRFIHVSMAAKHLTNWRAALVYSPFIAAQIRKFAYEDPSSEAAKSQAENIAANYRRRSCPLTLYHQDGK